MPTSNANKLKSFAEDVQAGLSAKPKSLSSKYFYDDEGSRLFQAIMQLPEYYLTRAEQDIFQTQTSEIYAAFSQPSADFDLVELGAGDGFKTAILIDHLLKQTASFSYTPIDISSEAINSLTEKFKADFPALHIDARTGDYFQILETLKTHSQRRKVLLFLGSNIGNFTHSQALDFFGRLRNVMNAEDQLFIGFDLQKDPHIILRAYDDAQGVTAQFNLNLLRRINRELGGDFVIENFMHYALYHPADGAARSFLVSRFDQTVTINALQRDFHFKAWEPIFMEISQKYSEPLIAELAQASGFEVVHNFYDSQHYFADSLWKIR